MSRPPLPPQGSEPWFPTEELVGALDWWDAAWLQDQLADARRELWQAYFWALCFVVCAACAVWGAALGRLPEALCLLVLGGASRWVARLFHANACKARREAYVRAERVLASKLARDERPHVLRAIGGGAA